MWSAAEADTIGTNFGNQTASLNSLAGAHSTRTPKLSMCINRVDRWAARLHTRTAIRMFDDDDASIAHKVANVAGLSSSLTSLGNRTASNASKNSGIDDNAISNDRNGCSGGHTDINGWMIESLTEKRRRGERIIIVLSQWRPRKWIAFNSEGFHACPSVWTKHAVNRQPLIALKERHGLRKVPWIKSRIGPRTTENIDFNLIDQIPPTQ
jgi:hypothetical protein